jgi:hypothetical protein
MGVTLIKNKNYATIEVDSTEKDVIQFISHGKEMDIVFIEKDKIKELIELLTYIYDRQA